MKKNLMTAALVLFAFTHSFAQNTASTVNNSWLKAGLEVSVPVGDIADYSAVSAGVVLSGQWLVNPNLGLGVASGYTHYFAKNDNTEDFGLIPAGLLVRYYPKAQGFFAGVDGGYSFLINRTETGGAYIKPQLGYHDYNWNFYGFYNHVFLDNINVQNVGIAATYNLRFRK